MKRKNNQTCHVLEFAKRLCEDGTAPWLQDLKLCEETVKKAVPGLTAEGYISQDSDVKNIARTAFTVAQWMKTKQCYSITKELAVDLFSTDDLSIPLEMLHLPFPVFYLDMEKFQEPMAGHPGATYLGSIIMIQEILYGDVIASCCSIVTIGLGEDGQYVYGNTSFDYYPEYMENSLEETVELLTKNFTEGKQYIKNALMFAAYLSSEQPEITENEIQKKIYRSSVKPKYSSLRKWDVGVRYAKEKQVQKNMETKEMETVKNIKAGRKSPRIHMRRAHWQTYRVGPGRRERKLLWIPPVTVGGGKGEAPVVVRELN